MCMSASSGHVDKKFMPLANFPREYPESSVTINESTVLVAFHSGCGADDGTWKGIYKYDIHKDQWTKFVKYPEHRRLLYPSMAFNSQTNRLYVYSYSDLEYHPHYSNPYPMNIIDISTATFDMNKAKNQNKIIRGLLHPSVLFNNLDGRIHVIGDREECGNIHFCYDAVKNCFMKIHDFAEKKRFFGTSAVYVPSQQQIFLFSKYGVAVFFTRIHKWKWLQDIKFIFGDCSTVLTSNERYIIITAKVGQKSTSNYELYQSPVKIYVFNTADFTLYESSVRYPFPRQEFKDVIFRTGNKLKDEILVAGWIKSMFISEKCKNISLPPTAVMDLIISWYSQKELIHFLSRHDEYSGKHLAIDIQHII